MQWDDPALPDALGQGDILTEDSQGGHNGRHPLEDGQEETGNTDEQEDDAHGNTHRSPCGDDSPYAFGEIETSTDKWLGGHAFPFSIGTIEKRTGHFQRYTTQLQDTKEINAPARFLPAH